jgi:glutathione synthase/RimK-type ligase-like ATP-grasp enzyme
MSLLVDSSTDFSSLPEMGAYTLVQEHIRKIADLRIFYLDGKIFSTAIFSQNDPQTRIDFRRYNDENPNRIQPFKLPDAEEDKIRQLMKKLDYKTGSIDYIYSCDKRFVFLEINPIGQYGFISGGANLFLNKEIAQYFKQLEAL